MISEDDNELWDKVTEDVEPLSDQPRTPSKTGKSPSLNVNETIRPPSIDTSSLPKGKELDRKTAQKLRKGEMRIEGRLDLHGMSLEQAHQALPPFILRAYNEKKRCVVVVTGKGKGILQRHVPEWLSHQPLHAIVLRAVPAQPKDGGSGALYVYLRRHR